MRMCKIAKYSTVSGWIAASQGASAEIVLQYDRECMKRLTTPTADGTEGFTGPWMTGRLKVRLQCPSQTGRITGLPPWIDLLPA